MDEVLVFILATWFTIATAFSLQFATVDYRNFDRIVQQCEKQGFIQDKTIRVKCTVEK